MNKNNNVFTVVVAAVVVAALGFLFWNGSKNKASAPPATDGHGMSANIGASVAPLNELVNKPVPNFALADIDGKIYSSDGLRGKNIILFFNEGLMCYPGCWNQIAALGKDERFKNTDTVALSVVVDAPEDWRKAIAKMPELAEATILFDKGKTVSNQFGMLTTESSMHYGLFPGHSYVVIDKEGIVRYALDDPNMGIHNDRLAGEIEKFNQ